MIQSEKIEKAATTAEVPYLVVTSHAHSLTEAAVQLATAVDEQMAIGWRPQGGVSVTTVPESRTGGGFFIYAQAMVRKG